jgi:predicted PurR-regulated permease PerM
MSFLNQSLLTSIFSIGIVALAFWTLRSMIAPLVLAVIVAVLIYPLYQIIRRRLKQNENLSAFLMTVFILVLIILPIFFLGSVLIRELQNLYELINNALLEAEVSGNSSIIENISRWGNQYGLDIKEVLKTYVLPGISQTTVILTAVASNALGLMFGFIMVIVSLFFMLRDGEKLIKFLQKISPLSEQNTKYFFNTCRNVIQGVLWANILTACAQGIIGGIGFAIFGLPSPIFWGVVMFGFSLIPFFGPAFVYVPTAFLLFLSTRNLQSALLFLGFNVLFVSTVDNIIKPLVIGSKVKIHPLITFLSIIGGLRAWGILGIIYGPLVAALLLLVIDLHLKETKQRSFFEE